MVFTQIYNDIVFFSKFRDSFDQIFYNLFLVNRIFDIV